MFCFTYFLIKVHNGSYIYGGRLAGYLNLPALPPAPSNVVGGVPAFHTFHVESAGCRKLRMTSDDLRRR